MITIPTGGNVDKSVHVGARQRRGGLAAIVTALLAVCAPATATRAQDAATVSPAPAAAPIEQRVDSFVELLEARRQELGVVGAAVVVAHGDRIVRATGLGRRSLGEADPVTDETVFAVGSVTKQFTAMAVALAVSDGKMAFEDHPRRYMPSFRLQDPHANAHLNMIDLLAHRSGLDRSDVTWMLAPFTQEEMFELARRAKPAAKLREKFLYNNTMYTLAGAALARAQQTTYERLMTQRLLEPIGMRSSTLTLQGLAASPNRAVGYSRSSTGASKEIKPIDLASVAPAGALNSTARDMGAWLTFLNARGRRNGTQMVAPPAFARLFEAHQPVGPRSSYGLGFFLQIRSGVLVAEHGGNVPGYTAQIVHVPDRALSFALLTNQDASQLAAVAHELFWDVIVKPELPAVVGSPADRPQPKLEAQAPAQRGPIAPERLAGSYFASLGGAFEVKTAAGGLVGLFAGQPPYPLKATEVNAFDLSGLSGYSVRFAESNVMPGRITALLRQPPPHPIGNIDFLRRDEAWLAIARAQHGGTDKELIGSYRSGDQAVIMEIVPYRSRVALIITGQTPWLMKNLSSDLYQLEGLPDTYQVRIKRSSNGSVVGFMFSQPNVRLEMSATTPSAGGNAEDAPRILARAMAAAGGADALDGITSMSAFGRASAETHGLEGHAEDHTWLGQRAELIELGAFGKTVLRVRAITSAARSVTVLRDGEQLPAAGKALRVMQLYAVPHPLYRWQERFVTVAAAGQVSINGEDAFVIELAARDLAPGRLYISTRSYLILREEVPSYVGDELQPTPISVDYSDYRAVSGVQMPFAASVPVPHLGRVAVAYERVSLNQPVDPKIFEEPRP
jgi:CubicO group peptidase (beta-lactamase class C family)